MTEIRELFDLTKTIAADLFAGKTYPWEVLADIRPFILRLGETLPADEFDHPSEGVWIAKDAKIFPSAISAHPVLLTTVLRFVTAPLSARVLLSGRMRSLAIPQS